MSNLKSIAELQGFLNLAIEKTSFQAKPAELYEPISYILSLGGKRLRPVLVLMSADMYGYDLFKALPQAIGIELFHNFTLMHDDIMDDAPLRRGKTTVHEKWDANIGILSGDALFVKAYQAIVKADSKHLPALMDLFNQTALEVCEGQQYDMNFESQEDVSMPSYLKMIKFKTAVLLACALKSGALIADASAHDQQNLYDFGIHIGLAFQLMDDILDVYGDQEDFGKQIAGDILCNKKTCLYIKAYEKADEQQRKVLDHYFAHQDFDALEKIFKVMEVYAELEVRDACRVMMDEHYSIAMKHLNALSVREDRKSTLVQFAELLMVRVN
jgi:geranylgeranyl diphosphate synthase, type II